MKESLFIGKIVFCRGPGKTQAVYISVAGRQKIFSLVLIKNKLGCNLNPRRGSFSIPVTNLSILPRSTLPLLPPVMNIKISVHNGFHNFRNH